MTALKSSAEIAKAIKSIGARSANLMNDVQSAGIDVIRHIEAHGDVTLLNRLYHAMGDSMRTAAFSAWVLAYAKVKANTGKDKADVPFVFDKSKTTDVQSAMLNKWWTCGAPEKAPDEVFDLAKALQSVLKKATKEGVKLPDSVTLEHIDAIKSVIAAVSAG